MLVAITTRKYWNLAWKDLPDFEAYSGPIFEQHTLLEKFIRQGIGLSALEIGCVPGNWMIYLNKEYGYEVSGIDYSDKIAYVSENLKFNKVVEGEIIKSDLFCFESRKLYDLVFSSGFVEHFENYQDVVDKHAALTRPGGQVVIMVPNLTHIHKHLCRLFQPAVFKAHVLTLMYKKNLRKSLEDAGLEVIYCDYHKTLRPTYQLPYLLALFFRVINKILKALNLDNYGNAFGSPYLVSISRKPPKFL